MPWHGENTNKWRTAIVKPFFLNIFLNPSTTQSTGSRAESALASPARDKIRVRFGPEYCAASR